MTAEECARIILKSACRRKREVLMGPGAVALRLKMIAPGLLDRRIDQWFMGPAIRRASQAKG